MGGRGLIDGYISISGAVGCSGDPVAGRYADIAVDCPRGLDLYPARTNSKHLDDPISKQPTATSLCIRNLGGFQSRPHSLLMLDFPTRSTPPSTPPRAGSSKCRNYRSDRAQGLIPETLHIPHSSQSFNLPFWNATGQSSAALVGRGLTFYQIHFDSSLPKTLYQGEVEGVATPYKEPSTSFYLLVPVAGQNQAFVFKRFELPCDMPMGSRRGHRRVGFCAHLPIASAGLFAPMALLLCAQWVVRKDAVSFPSA